MQNRGLWVALLIVCPSATGINVGNSFACVSGVVVGSGVCVCVCLGVELPCACMILIE